MEGSIGKPNLTQFAILVDCWTADLSYSALPTRYCTAPQRRVPVLHSC